MAVRIFGKGFLWVFAIVLLGGNLLVGARKFKGEGQVPEAADDPLESIALFTTVMEQVREYYVDGEKVGYDSLVRSALSGMLPDLDEHSSFLDATTYSDMQEDTSGRFGGLGVVVSVREGVLTVVAPMEDTPGFRAGILSGDKIIEIDGESTKGMTLTEAVKVLRGEIGTEVDMKIFRPSTSQVDQLTLVRQDIKVSSVKGAKMLENGIGYVRITQFNQPTAELLQEAIDSLREEGLQALVIDLRDNPGGLLSAAIEVSQKFLPPKAMVVYTQGRHPHDRKTYEARGPNHYLEIPVAILINEGSASASEIVSGALQDHKRAILVGVRSFGKGSVQSVLPLEDGSAVRLTTAKYYTPSERVIHGKGIEPDSF